MNYQQTIDFLFSQLPMYQRKGKAAYKANLNNTHALCALLGHPEKQLKTIHIAGTNGKGSTAHFMASVLQESGFKTGLYTSPHLLDFRERIRIDGKMIEKQAVVDFVADFTEAVSEIQPSFFEWSFALALSHFTSNGVDIAVFETGLGGRLDSTNVILPEVSVITNIGLDHMQFLGETQKEIANEKAGIIKPGVPVIIGETQPEISRVFSEKAKHAKAPITFADNWLPAPEVDYKMFGSYQKRNIQTAWCAVNKLSDLFSKAVNSRNFARGVERVILNTGLRGRWEVLSKTPLVIADTAHNAEGLHWTMRQLIGLRKENMHMVFGMVDDKNPKKILDLLPKEARYYLCEATIPRAMKLENLERIFSEAGYSFVAIKDVGAAKKQAIQNAGENDVVYIGGSTFVVAEALE